uniref:PWI domain-containing protein n=1 Tax=Cyprinodon variegatus TaxID=28743 RepID=A0A3Q2GP10_CYPVA
MDAGFFRGTSAEQDNRFSNKHKKLLKQLKFAECLDKKVDMTKVNLEVIKPWITQRVTEILGFEDDVVIEFIFNQLEEKVKHRDCTCCVWFSCTLYCAYLFNLRSVDCGETGRNGGG